MLITPTGLSLEMTTPDNIVKTDLHAVPLDPEGSIGPPRSPAFTARSTEHGRHYRPSFTFTPPSPRLSRTASRTCQCPRSPRTSCSRRVPCVDVAPSGSIELAGLVEVAFSLCSEVRAILLRAHGMISAGSDLVEAYDLADLVEDTARVAYLSLALGVPLAEMVEVALRPLRKG